MDIKLTIDGTEKELNLVRERGKKAWRVVEVPRRLTAGGGDVLNYSSLEADKELVFAQNNWQGGFGQGNFRDPDRYSDGQSIDTTLQGKFILGPEIQTTTASGGGNLGEAVVDFCYFGSALYCATTTKVWKWNTGTSVWDNQETFAGETISQLHSFGGYLFVALGSSTAYEYSSDGSSFTTATMTDCYADYFLTSTAGSGSTQILWKVKTPNELASHSTGLNGTDWSSVYYVGDTGANITRIMLLNDNLLVGREDNLYHLDSEGVTHPLMPELINAQSSVNFKHVCNWQASLYFSVGSRVGEITSYNSIDLMGPLAGIEELEMTGECCGLSSDRDWIYCFIDDGTNTTCYKGREIREGGELKWQWCPWIALSTNACDAAYVCQLSGENTKLWFGYGNNAAYVILSDNPLADSNYKFAAQGHLITGWYDANFRTWDKLVQSIVMENRGSMSANIKVTPYLEADEAGSYTQIGSAAYTAAAAPTKKYLTANVSYNKIRYKIQLDTNDDTKTPIVKLFSANGQLRPEKVKLYDFIVDVSSNRTRPSSTIRTFLEGGRDSTSLVTLTDRFGTDHYVVFLPGYPEEMEVVDEVTKQSTVALHVIAMKVDWS